MWWKIFLVILGLAIIVIILTTNKNLPIKTNLPDPVPTNTVQVPGIEVIAQNLEVPWALAFLPDGKILVTERVGRVKLVAGDTVSLVSEIMGVFQNGESGLHGIAIDPDYPNMPYVYLYYTYSGNGNNSLNKVSRFTFNGQSLKDERTIVDKIPGAIFHDGGRIKFGPDGYLYITTGDAQNPSLAQGKNSLAGKILRVKDEGKVEIYSYGHRNPQGITWDNIGNLWETEHGQTATDEVNLIQPGRNYGWPIIKGDQSQEDMASPKLQSGSTTWAPAGIAFYKGSLFFGGLKSETLFEVKVGTYTLKEYFKGQLGRIREVVLGPDNMLYITTSNRDGRGLPKSDDDKIIRINPNTY